MGYKGERACRICGCTQNQGCQTETGPCRWIESRLCSAPGCAIHARALFDSDKPLLAKLVEDQRNLLLAKGSYEALAVEFNVAVGTIKSRISRGRLALAEHRRQAMEEV